MAHKSVLATRVDNETYTALERLAAVADSSLSHYASELLAAHVRRQQNNQTAGAVDAEVLQQFEEQLAGFEMRRARELELIVKRLERHFTVIKAMVDSLAENLIPDRRQDYVKTVERLVRAASMQNQNGGARSWAAHGIKCAGG